MMGTWGPQLGLWESGWGRGHPWGRGAAGEGEAGICLQTSGRWSVPRGMDGADVVGVEGSPAPPPAHTSASGFRCLEGLRGRKAVGGAGQHQPLGKLHQRGQGQRLEEPSASPVTLQPAPWDLVFCSPGVSPAPRLEVGLAGCCWGPSTEGSPVPGPGCAGGGWARGCLCFSYLH